MTNLHVVLDVCSMVLRESATLHGVREWGWHDTTWYEILLRVCLTSRHNMKSWSKIVAAHGLVSLRVDTFYTHLLYPFSDLWAPPRLAPPEVADRVYREVIEYILREFVPWQITSHLNCMRIHS